MENLLHHVEGPLCMLYRVNRLHVAQLHGGISGEGVGDTLQHRQQASLSLRSGVQHERSNLKAEMK